MGTHPRQSALCGDPEAERPGSSSRAAILIVPTIITGLYGMNFTYMPELDWSVGYPLAVALMFAISLALYFVFKRRGWL